MYTILRYLVLVIICLAAYYLGKNYIRQFREAKKMSDDQMEEQRRKKKPAAARIMSRPVRS